MFSPETIVSMNHASCHHLQPHRSPLVYSGAYVPILIVTTYRGKAGHHSTARRKMFTHFDNSRVNADVHSFVVVSASVRCSRPGLTREDHVSGFGSKRGHRGGFNQPGKGRASPVRPALAAVKNT